MHASIASRMAAVDTHIATQTANDGEQCPVFLDCCDVGNVQYSGLTRFLPVSTNRQEHYYDLKYNNYFRSLFIQPKNTEYKSMLVT